MILRVLGACLLALILAVALLLVSLTRGIELTWITGLIEREVSSTLRRSVKLGSPPYVRLGDELQIRVSDVWLTNAAWAGPGPLLTLRAAEVRVDTRSLLSGPVLIEHVGIDGLRIDLQKNEAGESNLPPRADDAAEDDDTEGKRGTVLKTIELTDIRITQRDESTGKERSFSIERYDTEVAEDKHLLLSGSGKVQGKPWQIAGEHSGVASVIAGKNLWGRLEGGLGNLAINASYELPTDQELRDLQARVRVEGSLPPRLAELSPLFTPDSPLLLNVAVDDIDPGVTLDAVLRVEDLEAHVRGRADRPGLGDGLDLSIDLKADSLPRLAAALELGDTEELSLSVEGRLNRDGRRIEIQELLVEAGEHRIQGNILIPEFPATDDADFDLRAAGPDFGFYQRLLNRPFQAPFPYSANVQLHRAADQRGALETQVDIGGATVRASGLLGEFPSYRNSELRLSASSEDLQQVGRTLEIELPRTPVDARAVLQVSDDGRLTITDLYAVGAGAEIRGQGAMNTYPALDELESSLTLSAPSLQRTAGVFGVDNLGDVPAELSLRASGSAASLKLSDLALSAGASELRSTVGVVTLERPDVKSDITLHAALDNLPAVLGGRAPEQMPTAPVSFELTPTVSDQGYALTLTDVQGPGVQGSAELRMGRALLIDEKTYLKADLTFDDPSRFLPALKAYEPPRRPLKLIADTRGGSGQIDAQLRSGGAEILALSARREGEGNITVTARGGGTDLRVLGSSPYLPAGDLPFRVDVAADFVPGHLDVDIRNLSVAQSELSGSVVLHREPDSIDVDLTVPQADLAAWLRAANPPEDVAQEDPPPVGSPPERLIPDTPLPLDALEGANIAVHLRTGPLGLKDRFFRDASLIDQSELFFTRNQGRAALQVARLTGSRGRLEASIAATRSVNGAAIEGNLQAQEIPAGMISAGTTLEGLPKHDLTTSYTASGRTVRDLTSSLNGELFLTGGAGTLNDLSISFITDSFLQQLLSTLLPGVKSDKPDMQVECTVLAARAENGVVTLDPGFVLRSERVDLSARGTVDLKRERFAIRFDNQARKGLGISAASLVNPYVQITGTLAKPKMGLDISGSAIAGGAAVATGGLTVLAKPLYGRFLDRRNPCEVATDRWERDQT